MRVFLTILGDSIRLLRARALFWISLGISVFAALLYLSIGFDEKGISFVFGAFHFEEAFLAKGSEGAELVYLTIFRNIIVAFWLSWIAIIIALISCAPIFPEFMSEGSAGVALSKPVSRPQLFIYKFVGALLFMAVQATLFAVIVFIAIRWRVGLWNPSVFWSVPILLLVFSYLYSVLVLLGIKTKSVMASILMTLLFWLICWVAQFGEAFTYQGARGGTGIAGMPGSGESKSSWETAHRWTRGPYAVLPKPGETTALLDRLIVLGDGESLGGSIIAAATKKTRNGEFEGAEEELHRHSPAWVIGSSLVFELLVLALACRMFSRRDF
jgi:ABC-type transport system involved in multi-copper enzyme maturation permease subunit